MKLEVKHLAHYLPYGLKLKVDNQFGTYISELVVHSFGNDLRNGININEAINHNAQPFLMPLQYLTKEIEVNGERFIPLIKIAELFVMGVNPRIITSTNGGCVVTYKDNGEEYLMLIQFISEGTFVLKLLSTGNIVRIDNFSIFQKLAEWHFDIFNLIGQGLAVDINTLSVE